MNNTLLGMLLNATTGSLPADSTTSAPRWSGPDPVIVQVQCILYAALSAALLASFLATLGKQWLNRYMRSETHGSTADRSRVRERKLNGIGAWKFHLVMESLPLWRSKCTLKKSRRTDGKSHARTHHHVARTSNLSHGHPDFPWGDFPARPGLNQRRGS